MLMGRKFLRHRKDLIRLIRSGTSPLPCSYFRCDTKVSSELEFVVVDKHRVRHDPVLGKVKFCFGSPFTFGELLSFCLNQSSYLHIKIVKADPANCNTKIGNIAQQLEELEEKRQSLHDAVRTGSMRQVGDVLGKRFSDGSQQSTPRSDTSCSSITPPSTPKATEKNNSIPDINSVEHITIEGVIYLQTALDIAAISGKLEMVRLLLSHGAKFNREMYRYAGAITKDGYVSDGPILFVLSCGKASVELLQLLIENQAVKQSEISQLKLHSGKTSLHIASQHNNLPVARYLLEYCQVDVNASATTTQETALHHSASADMTRVLIERGANVNFRSKDGNMPLHLLARRGDVESCRLLLESGAKVDATNLASFTALHEATRGRHLSVVELLVENGASVHLTTNAKMTPLDYALASSASNGALISFLKHNVATQRRISVVPNLRRHTFGAGTKAVVLSH